MLGELKLFVLSLFIGGRGEHVVVSDSNGSTDSLFGSLYANHPE
jgi:hypothetical protein